MDKPQQPKKKREPLLDHEDWLYIGAIVCIGGGASLYAVGAGLVSTGLLLLCWPLMARICSPGRTPPE